MLRFIDYPHWTSGVSEMSREAFAALSKSYETFREWVAKHPDIAIMLPGQRPENRAKALESMPMAVHDEIVVYVPSAERQAEVADQLAALISNPVHYTIIKGRPSTGTPLKFSADLDKFSIGCSTPTDKST